MPSPTDVIMEEASQALVRMDYLTSEALCLRALASAREARDWALYARVLLPLQECRRQRRMIAADGPVRLGSAAMTRDVSAVLDKISAGCLVLTHPHGSGDAQRLESEARKRRLHVEILLADNALDAQRWTIRSFAGPAVACERPAPPAAWRDRWLSGRQPAATGGQTVKGITPQPADWFIDATEALGNAALAQVTAPPGDARRVAELEACLACVTDHEILHQRLADAARAMARNTR